MDEDRKVYGLISFFILVETSLIVENIGSLESQNATRTALDTFTTRQAPAILDRHTQPGVPADVDTNRAMKCTHSTLHAA